MMSSAHVLIFIRFYCIPFGALQPTFLRNNESIFPRQRLVCPLHCTLCLSLLGIISDHLVIVKMSCLSICAWFWTLLSKKVKKYIFFRSLSISFSFPRRELIIYVAQYTQKNLEKLNTSIIWRSCVFLHSECTNAERRGMWHHVLGPKVSSWISCLVRNLFWLLKGLA